MNWTNYLLIAGSVIIVVAICISLFLYKRNKHTQLYSIAIRNENAGELEKALHDYEAALNEVTQLKLDKKFGEKIEQKIKILRLTIDYEKNFQN